MSTNDIAAMTPVEIDTELARLWGERAKHEARLDSAKSGLAREMARPSFSKGLRDSYVASIARAEAAIEALRAEAEPFEAEYARRPWNRYFLVTNGNGHVHRGMDCTTCFATTQYAWLIDLADCDEDAMIEEWGERACTVCFPSAPTNPLYTRPARVDREAKAARDAEKAARDAARAEKAITAPDGGPLRVPDGGYTEVIKTKVAARNALSQAVKDLAWYGLDHPSRFQVRIPVLVAALEAAGIETAPVMERALKAAKKDGAPYGAAVQGVMEGASERIVDVQECPGGGKFVRWCYDRDAEREVPHCTHCGQEVTVLSKGRAAPHPVEEGA